MNYKKGIIRLLILGFIISPIIAYFETADNRARLKDYFAENTKRVSIAMADPKCMAIHNSGDGINSMKEGIYCFSVWSYWKDLKDYQGPPPDYRAIKDVMAQKERMTNINDFLPVMFKNFGLYLLFLISVFGIFFIGKWIIKGFKSA